MQNKVKSAVYPLISVLVVVLAWHVAVLVFDIQYYILPSPLAVIQALFEGFVHGNFLEHSVATLEATVIGYAVGCGLAFVFGVLVAESDTFDKFVYPCIVGLQSVPKVALAPLILVWFGFEIESKVVLVGLICFFPLFVNTVVGIGWTDADLIDACRAFSASRAYVFFHAKLPSAASEIFARLEIGIVLALIGAIVAEFVASQSGLGHMIDSAAVSLTTANMFAGVIILSVMGIAGTALVRVIHRRVVFWERGAARVNLGVAS